MSTTVTLELPTDWQTRLESLPLPVRERLVSRAVLRDLRAADEEETIFGAYWDALTAAEREALQERLRRSAEGATMTGDAFFATLKQHRETL